MQVLLEISSLVEVVMDPSYCSLTGVAQVQGTELGSLAFYLTRATVDNRPFYSCLLSDLAFEW